MGISWLCLTFLLALSSKCLAADFAIAELYAGDNNCEFPMSNAQLYELGVCMEDDSASILATSEANSIRVKVWFPPSNCSGAPTIDTVATDSTTCTFNALSQTSSIILFGDDLTKTNPEYQYVATVHEFQDGAGDCTGTPDTFKRIFRKNMCYDGDGTGRRAEVLPNNRVRYCTFAGNSRCNGTGATCVTGNAGECITLNNVPVLLDIYAPVAAETDLLINKIYNGQGCPTLDDNSFQVYQIGVCTPSGSTQSIRATSTGGQVTIAYYDNNPWCSGTPTTQNSATPSCTFVPANNVSTSQEWGTPVEPANGQSILYNYQTSGCDSIADFPKFRQSDKCYSTGNSGSSVSQKITRVGDTITVCDYEEKMCMGAQLCQNVTLGVCASANGASDRSIMFVNFVSGSSSIPPVAPVPPTTAVTNPPTDVVPTMAPTAAAMPTDPVMSGSLSLTFSALSVFLLVCQMLS